MDRIFSRRSVLAAAGAALAIPSSALAIDSHDEVKFKAKTIDGESFSTESVRGKIVLIQFWATWCPYCKSDAPAVDKLLREFKEQNLEVLAVNMGESKRTIAKFLTQNPRACKIVMLEDTNLAAWFGPRGYPYYAALNRNVTQVGEQRGAGGERSLRHLLRQAGIKTEDTGTAGDLKFSPRRDGR